MSSSRRSNNTGLPVNHHKLACYKYEYCLTPGKYIDYNLCLACVQAYKTQLLHVGQYFITIYILCLVRASCVRGRTMLCMCLARALCVRGRTMSCMYLARALCVRVPCHAWYCACPIQHHPAWHPWWWRRRQCTHYVFIQRIGKHRDKRSSNRHQSVATVPMTCYPCLLCSTHHAEYIGKLGLDLMNLIAIAVGPYHTSNIIPCLHGWRRYGHHKRQRALHVRDAPRRSVCAHRGSRGCVLPATHPSGQHMVKGVVAVGWRVVWWCVTAAS